MRTVQKAGFKFVKFLLKYHPMKRCHVRLYGLGMIPHDSEIHPSSPMSLETSVIHDRPKKQFQIIFIVFAQPDG